MFKLIKEIRSKEGKVHFRRWELISTRWGSIYIHGIYIHDEDDYLHDHPWDYTSIVLKGSYVEETMHGENVRLTLNYAKRKAEDFHKILRLGTDKVFTLMFVGPRRRNWGYNVEGQWIDHSTFRWRKNNNDIDREKMTLASDVLAGGTADGWEDGLPKYKFLGKTYLLSFNLKRVAKVY